MSAKNSILPEKFRVPAEWEPQEAIYLAVSPGNEFDPSQFKAGNKTVNEVQFAMIRALQGHTTIRIIASNDTEVSSYKDAMKLAGLDPVEVEFVLVDHCDIWLRDTGPIWAINDTGETALVWMGFNNWGYAPYILGDWAQCDIPNFIPRDLGAVLSKPVFHTSLIGEGGDKSFNGQGALICCKAVEMNRNPDLPLDQLEELLKSSFNVSHIVWVARGLADDYQSFRVQPEFGDATLPNGVFTLLCTGGHVDEFCRFVDDKKVLLAEVHPEVRKNASEIDDITHFNMEGNYALLKEQTNQAGNPLEIVRMPLPPSMFFTIDQRDPVYPVLKALKGVHIEGPIKVVLAASYCNYLISNGVICFPKYFRDGMDPLVDKIDQEALTIMRGLFPEHEIVQIDPAPLNAGGGGMHCISNNQPKR